MTNRTGSLAAALRQAGARAYFAQAPVTMAYLHGFGEDGHERLLTLVIRDDGKVALICPSLAENQAKRAGIIDVRCWKDGEDPAALVRDLALEWGLDGGTLLVDDSMRASAILLLQSTLPRSAFGAGGTLLSTLMRKKDPRELALMTQAAKVADDAFTAVLPRIQAGMTELGVGRMLLDEMADRGGKPTFAIVAAGAMGAEPHHQTDETLLAPGDVVVLDFGCDVGGYQSDITRTVAIGEPEPEADRVYEAVYSAHMAGRGAVRPGVTAGSVDAAARSVIDRAGYGDFFYHRLGHGIGMNGHEEPNLTPGSQVELQPGDCFSVEPGVYLAGKFGVRIENIVTVTESSVHSFNVDPSPTLLRTGQS